MLTTLVVCLANCIATPTSIEDQLGTLAGSYVQLCYEMHHLKRAQCPANLELPVIMQCFNDVDRELPANYRPEFRKGIGAMQSYFENQLANQVEAKFNRIKNANSNDQELACYDMVAENKKQRFQKMQQLKILSKKSH